jgi:hypothetical protein
MGDEQIKREIAQSLGRLLSNPELPQEVKRRLSGIQQALSLELPLPPLPKAQQKDQE